MKTVLFLQSEESDPFKLYNEHLSTSPIYRDEEKNITAVYSYADCLTVLNCPVASVPQQNNTGLNDSALLIADRLARFSNTPHHAVAKKAAHELHQRVKPIAVSQVLTNLLKQFSAGQEFDWVKQISRRLPVFSILKGFDFNDEDCEYLSDAIPSLVKLMQPGKTNVMIENINRVSESCYHVIEKNILQKKDLGAVVNNICAEFSRSKEDALAICVANLAGLMTQSYDACSGLLSNSCYTH